MKRALVIFICGLALAIAGFASTYHFSTARSLEQSPKPELAWLKQEYQLDDEQYTRACELYAAYHPHCLEMCRRIDESNAHLKQLLAATNVVTPEIKQALADTAQLRTQCESAMLNHFYAVSQTMPPAQGRRYLTWMQSKTLMASPMSADQSNQSSTH